MKNLDLLKEKLTPVVESFDTELVEIEVKKGKGDDLETLVVYCYCRNGATDLELLEKIHNAIDPIVDEINPSDDIPYNLNVSSLGLDRAFKTEADFKRNLGKEIELRFYAPFNGKKVWKGILKDFENNVIFVETDGKIEPIDFKKTSKVSLAINF